MAMYRCNLCQKIIDDDWHPGQEDPLDDCALLCPDCAEEYECPDCGFIACNCPEDDDDGQPDEAQEWHDYDPDC